MGMTDRELLKVGVEEALVALDYWDEKKRYAASESGNTAYRELIADYEAELTALRDQLSRLRGFVERVSRTWPDNLDEVLSAQLMEEYAIEARSLLSSLAEGKRE